MARLIADYQEAARFYQAGQYGAALEKIMAIRRKVSCWTRLDLLEAHIYRAQGKYLTELRCLGKSLGDIRVETAEARKEAAELWSLMGSALHRLGRAGEAVKAFRQAARYEGDAAQQRVEFSNAMFAASAAAHYGAGDYRRLQEEYRSLLADIVPYPVVFHRHERLRIGYLSADFCLHPVAHFLWTLLRFHSREQFRLYGYAANPPSGWDAATRRMQAEIEEWRDISACSDEEAAAQIRQDEIDILFDLSGHTKGNRLPVLSYHPAAVQISGLGDVNSTGTDFVEYFWSDRNCCPDAAMARAYYPETMLDSLPGSICYTPLKPMPEPQEAPCVRRGDITFGCFNNFSKVTDEMLGVWADLLHRVPQSRFLWKHRLFDSAEGRQFMRLRAEQAGIPWDRVELRGFSGDYLREYADVDIALDTYPYVGEVTTCEALYMGVPVITLAGERCGTRKGWSILQNIGLPELAAFSYEEYLEKAAALASDRELVQGLHQELRGMMQRSPLMDSRRYMERVEGLFHSLWKKALAAGNSREAANLY